MVKADGRARPRADLCLNTPNGCWPQRGYLYSDGIVHAAPDADQLGVAAVQVSQSAVDLARDEMR